MKLNKKVVLILCLGLMAAMFSSCKTNANGEAQSPTPATANKGDYPPAPTKLMNAELAKLDGSKFKLTDYKGKVLIVNIWATWCGPCRHEIPAFVKLQAELKEKGLEIIGLNVDDEDTLDMIKAFGKELNVNYDLVTSEEELFGEFYYVSKMNAIPQSFLIDREGRLLGVFVGGGNATLQKLIDNTRKVVETNS